MIPFNEVWTFTFARGRYHRYISLAVTILFVASFSAETSVAQMYAVTFNGQLKQIDPITYSLTHLESASGPRTNSLSYSPTAGLFSFSSTSPSGKLIQIDTSNGSQIASTNFSGLSDVRGIAFDENGTLYGITSADGIENATTSINQLISFDLSGSFSFIGSTGQLAVQGLDFDSNGVLYAWTKHEGLGTIDISTGAFSDINNTYSDSSEIMQSIAFDENGSLFGVSQRKLYQIDPNTGVETHLINYGIEVDLRGLEFVLVPEPLILALIDIKPGSFPNSINLKSKGVLPVAILGTDVFDVTEVDIDSLRFGDPLLINNDETAVRPLRSAYEDVSGDGLLDLILKFSIAKMVAFEVLGMDTAEGRLTGFLDGTSFAGMDSIRIVPPNGSKGNSLQVSAVPEPTTSALALATVCLAMGRRRLVRRW